MKTWVLFGLLLTAAVIAEDDEDEEKPGCNPEVCKLPSCRCSSTETPGSILPRNTPQFVMLNFDEAVSGVNIFTYRDLLYNRRNSNGCPVGTTFYINHEYTVYPLVNELYNRGFEIGLRSISHRSPPSFWATASYDVLVQEFADQRRQMERFANIPPNDIKGIRSPFLQMAGNTSFEMMANNSFLYDHSWPTVTFANPGLWPYTLDYKSSQDCVVNPCPNASIPGPWVLPINTWRDERGEACSYIDACFWVPSYEDENAWYTFIMRNFERHYLGTRAPFGFLVRESFLNAFPAVRRAFVRFLNLINNLNDVFMVNSYEVIEWVKNPVPIDEYRRQECHKSTPTSCTSKTCYYRAEHNNMEYWLQICGECPNVYPWVGNPLGE